MLKRNLDGTYNVDCRAKVPAAKVRKTRIFDESKPFELFLFFELELFLLL